MVQCLLELGGHLCHRCWQLYWHWQQKKFIVRFLSEWQQAHCCTQGFTRGRRL